MKPFSLLLTSNSKVIPIIQKIQICTLEVKEKLSFKSSVIDWSRNYYKSLDSPFKAPVSSRENRFLRYVSKDTERALKIYRVQLGQTILVTSPTQFLRLARRSSGTSQLFLGTKTFFFSAAEAFTHSMFMSGGTNSPMNLFLRPGNPAIPSFLVPTSKRTFVIF